MTDHAPTAYDQPTSAASGSHLRDASGFTLVELMVVMAIVVVLSSIVVFMLLGARTTAHQREASVTANSYLQAISMFMTDHGNHIPIADADWYSKGPCAQSPTSTTAATPDVSCGPVNPLGNMYMHDLPTPVAEGRVQVCLNDLSAAATVTARRYPGSCADTVALSRVIYQPSANSLAYALIVYVRKNTGQPFPSIVDATQAYCVTGSDTTVTTPAAPAKKPRTC